MRDDAARYDARMQTPVTPGALPSTTDAPRGPSGPLFSPKQIALATLFGTPIAGAILAAENFVRLDRRGMSGVALALGVGAIGGAVALDLAWSSAATFLAVPVWTAAAWLGAKTAFEPSLAGNPPRGSLHAIAVSALVLAALLGTARVAAIFAPDAVPTVAELAFDVLGMRGGQVRYRSGLDREDALRVRRALEHAGVLSEAERLALEVRRDEKLVVLLRLPDARPETIEAAKRFSRLLVDHLSPPECVVTRVLAPGGRQVLATGTTCPRP